MNRLRVLLLGFSVASIVFGAVLFGATLIASRDTVDAANDARLVLAGQVADRLRDSADFVHVAAVNRIDADDVAVTLVIDRGFHINANPASAPNLLPTTLIVTNAAPIGVTYPPGVSFKPTFTDDAIDVYEGTVRIVARFAPGTLNGSTRLRGSIAVQACTDVICLPPAELNLPAG